MRSRQSAKTTDTRGCNRIRAEFEFKRSCYLISTSCSNTTIAWLERDNLTSGQTEAVSHCTKPSELMRRALSDKRLEIGIPPQPSFSQPVFSRIVRDPNAVINVWHNKKPDLSWGSKFHFSFRFVDHCETTLCKVLLIKFLSRNLAILTRLGKNVTLCQNRFFSSLLSQFVTRCFYIINSCSLATSLSPEFCS